MKRLCEHCKQYCNYEGEYHGHYVHAKVVQDDPLTVDVRLTAAWDLKTDQQADGSLFQDIEDSLNLNLNNDQWGE